MKMKLLNFSGVQSLQESYNSLQHSADFLYKKTKKIPELNRYIVWENIYENTWFEKKGN